MSVYILVCKREFACFSSCKFGGLLVKSEAGAKVRSSYCDGKTIIIIINVCCGGGRSSRWPAAKKAAVTATPTCRWIAISTHKRSALQSTHALCVQRTTYGSQRSQRRQLSTRLYEINKWNAKHVLFYLFLAYLKSWNITLHCRHENLKKLVFL